MVRVQADVVVGVRGAKARSVEAWQVDIVCDSLGTREVVPCESRSEARSLASWFGTDGDLHAEVTRVVASPR